jgi:hypothetical protein
VLADQIQDAPTAIPLLNVLERKRRDLGAPKTAAEEYCHDRPVAQALLVLASGAFRSACTCLAVSQLPRRTPWKPRPSPE